MFYPDGDPRSLWYGTVAAYGTTISINWALANSFEEPRDGDDKRLSTRITKDPAKLSWAVERPRGLRDSAGNRLRGGVGLRGALREDMAARGRCREPGEPGETGPGPSGSTGPGGAVPMKLRKIAMLGRVVRWWLRTRGCQLRFPDRTPRPAVGSGHRWLARAATPTGAPRASRDTLIKALQGGWL